MKTFLAPLAALVLASLLALTSGVAVAQDAPPPFRSSGIVLLQPEAQIEARLGGDPEPLAAYLLAIFAALEETAKAAKPGVPTTGVMIVAVRTKGRARTWLAFGENAVPEALIESITTRVASIPAPTVSEGTISLQINLELWGGGAPISSAESPVFVPESWRSAAGLLGGTADTESILDVIWPEGG